MSSTFWGYKGRAQLLLETLNVESKLENMYTISNCGWVGAWRALRLSWSCVLPVVCRSESALLVVDSAAGSVTEPDFPRDLYCVNSVESWCVTLKIFNFYWRDILEQLRLPLVKHTIVVKISDSENTPFVEAIFAWNFCMGKFVCIHLRTVDYRYIPY